MSDFPWRDFFIFAAGTFLGALVTAFAVRDAILNLHRDLSKKIEHARYGD